MAAKIAPVSSLLPRIEHEPVCGGTGRDPLINQQAGRLKACFSADAVRLSSTITGGEFNVSQSTLSGSCLCGSVRYEISGDPRAFYHCHCRRCRKTTGTGHASNIILKPDAAKWLAGEELLESFKVPDAKRYRTVFCSNCGSPLPRIAPDLSLAVIPAGSLDESPAIDPTARIFWESRAAWSCDASEIPVWPEYPDDR